MRPLNINDGDRYGQLTIINFFGRIRRDRCWNCLCDCGKKCVVSTSDLRFRKNCGSYEHRRGKNSPHFEGYEEIHKSYWWMLRNTARKRKLKFSISMKYAWDLFIGQNRKCALTGVELKFKSKSALYDGTASLDRIDCSKGYVKGNVRWLDKDINIMKNSWTDEEFINICRKVTKFQSKGTE